MTGFDDCFDKDGKIPGSGVKRRLLSTSSAIVLSLAVLACGTTVTRHGNLLSQSDLQQVQPGSSQEQVKLALGTPDTTSTVGNGAYYYISQTREQTAFFKPKTTDRRIVAVYFDQFGTVENVAHYGLKDGKVFDYISRTTPVYAGDVSFIQKIFRGIGTPTPGGAPTPRQPGQPPI